MSGILLEEGTLTVGKLLQAGPYACNFVYTGPSKTNQQNRFREGDTLVEIGSQAIGSDADLLTMFAAKKAEYTGSDISFTLLRHSDMAVLPAGQKPPFKSCGRYKKLDGLNSGEKPLQIAQAIVYETAVGAVCREAMQLPDESIN